MGRPILQLPDVLINSGESATGWTASGTGASQSLATVTLVDGTVGTRVKATSGSGQNLFLTHTTGNVWQGKKGLAERIFLEAPDTADPGTIYSGYSRIRSSGAADQLQSILAFRPGWNELRLGRNKYTSIQGTPIWDSTVMVDTILKIDAVPGTVVSIYVDALSHAGYARPQMPFVFDDGYSEVYDNAFPYMAARGIVGTVAVISSKVGASGFMTLNQLKALHDAGWAMVNHSENHFPTSGTPANWLQAASVDTCYQEIMNCQRWLEKNGFTRNNEHRMYCSPYGEWSGNYKEAADRAGVLMFCTLAAADPAQPQSTPFASSYPNVRYVPRISTIRTWTVAQKKAYIDAHIGSGTSSPILYHRVMVGASQNIETELSEFKQDVDHCYRQRARADFPNLADFYYRTLNPTI